MSISIFDRLVRSWKATKYTVDLHSTPGCGWLLEFTSASGAEIPVDCVEACLDCARRAPKPTSKPSKRVTRCSEDVFRIHVL